MALDIDPNTNIDKNSGVYIEPPGLGVSWLWLGREDTLFYWAAVKHDLRYSQRAAGLMSGSMWDTSEYADNDFREDCYKILHDWQERRRRKTNRSVVNPELDKLALDVEALKVDIEMFYLIIRAVGKYRWPKIESDLKIRAVRVKESIEILQLLHSNGVM